MFGKQNQKEAKGNFLIFGASIYIETHTGKTKGELKMKKARLLFLTLIFAICAVGCVGKTNDSAKNEVFTDENFADVIQIRAIVAEPVSGEQMEEVICYLKGLTLIPTDQRLRTTDENGNVLYGPGLMTFRRTDGSETHFLFGHDMITCVDGESYLVEGENFYAGLRAAFGRE